MNPAALRLHLPPSSRPAAPVSRHARAVLLLLVLLSLWAYHGVSNCGFVVLDDDVAVEHNPHLRDGLTWKGVAWAFSTTYYDYWHPLPWLTHLADVSLYGMNPRGHHLTNLLFHLANVALVFLFLYALTSRLDISALAGALFAVHPIHVESVAWLVERKDVLACFFWYACLLAYLRYTRAPGVTRYLATLVLMALGLMAKPMAVTLPLVFLLLDVTVLGRDVGGAGTRGGRLAALALEKAPFALVAAVSSLVTLTVVSAAKGLSSVEATGIGTRLANAAVSYAIYLGKLFGPLGLAPYYPYDLAQPLWKGIVAGAVLVAVSTGMFLVRRRLPLAWVGWLWYLVTLLPVIGLVQTGAQAMADRFCYVPFAGLYLAVASAVCLWSSRSLVRQRVMWTGLCITVALLLGLTQRQVARWATSETLFRHTLAVTERNWFVHGNYATYLAKHGRYEEALAQLRAAVEIMPAHARAWSQLSSVMLHLGRTDEAVAAGRAAVGIAPDDPDMQHALAMALQQSGRAEEAVAHYRAALRADPGRWETLNNLGVLLSAMGHGSEATEVLTRACAAAPERFESHFNLGSHCVRVRDYACGRGSFAAALGVRPGDPSAMVGGAAALAGLGDAAAACAELAAARRAGADSVVVRQVAGEMGAVLRECETALR